MYIDEAIFINQLAQGIIEMREGEQWFMALNDELKRIVLRTINTMILQAHPGLDEAFAAIEISGFKRTLIPCVLLSKPNTNRQLAKMANLPPPELPKVFELTIRLLGIADRRRRETKPLDVANHWWHRDLGNPQVVADIREKYQSGSL